MTLGFTSLGLVLVLMIIVPTPLLLRKLLFIAYTCSYAYVAITNLWHLTRGLVTVSCRYLIVFCFHENRQLVVIISCFWDDLSPLFLLCQWLLNTIHVGETSHNWDTKLSHLLCGYGHSILWLRCALQPFGIKTLSQAYALVRINTIRLADCWASSVEWRIINGPFGNLFLTVFRWAVRVVSWPSHQLW